MKPPRTILYIRMSTAEQLKGDSHRRQFELGKQYVEKMGLILRPEDIYEDIGRSAYTGENVEKGKLGLILSKIASGEYPPGTIFLADSIDRISRQTPADGMLLVLEILQKGIKVITFGDGRVFDKEDKVENLLGLLLSNGRSNEESRNKGHHVSQAWVSKRKGAKDKILTSLCPGWLIANENRKGFEIVPEREPVIRQIIHWALSGMGSHAIVTRLNRESPQLLRSQ